MRENKDKRGMLVKVFVATTIVLALALVYVLIVQPGLNGYVVKAQNQGVEWAVVSIMQQAAKCQQVPLTYENQTINLVAVECLQQAQNQQTEQTAQQ
jgi:hypothetical protein